MSEKRSESQKAAWAKHTPAQREYRGFLISIGHMHKKHVELGAECDCEEARQKFINGGRTDSTVTLIQRKRR